MQKNRRLRIADPERDALRRTLEDLVPVRIVRIAEVIARLATRTIESTVGLRNTDLRLLNLLDGTEGITVNEIARRAHVDKAWVSRSLRHLESAGLVVRRTSRDNPRSCKVTLTNKGATLLDRVRPLAMAREQRLLEGIDEARFKKDLDRLMSNAHVMLAGPER
jgi:DNA-binding MarR family transcriptional regulator